VLTLRGHQNGQYTEFQQQISFSKEKFKTKISGVQNGTIHHNGDYDNWCTVINITLVTAATVTPSLQ